METSLWQIVLERIFDRILSLPEEQRKLAASYLSDCCAENPPQFFDRKMALAKLETLLNKTTFGPMR